jgi:hypothetical protein
MFELSGWPRQDVNAMLRDQTLWNAARHVNMPIAA